MEKILEKPTVAELITELQKLSQDKKIIINDTDTGWTIDFIHIEENEKRVELSGDYSEMRSY